MNSEHFKKDFLIRTTEPHVDDVISAYPNEEILSRKHRRAQFHSRVLQLGIIDENKECQFAEHKKSRSEQLLEKKALEHVKNIMKLALCEGSSSPSTSLEKSDEVFEELAIPVEFETYSSRAKFINNSDSACKKMTRQVESVELPQLNLSQRHDCELELEKFSFKQEEQKTPEKIVQAQEDQSAYILHYDNLDVHWVTIG